MFNLMKVILQGDAIHLPFPDSYFHTVVTSPPYWGLRKYSGKQGRIWGGDPICEHEWEAQVRKMQTGGVSAKQMSNKGVTGEGWINESSTCKLCGAWYGSLGLEPTPDLHIRNIIDIMAEVYRVLRDDGVVWLNYGDCFTSGTGRSYPRDYQDGGAIGDEVANPVPRFDLKAIGFPQGNIMFMPSRIGIALQKYGWIVRRDLIWWKRNPMPESPNGWRWEQHRIKVESADVDWREKAEERDGVLDGPGHVSGGNTGFGDKKPKWEDCPGCEICDPHDGLVLKKGSFRHTSAHEYIFMLSKKMQYWGNLEAVREAHTDKLGIERFQNKGGRNSPNFIPAQDDPRIFHTTKHRDYNPSGRTPRSVQDVPEYALEELWFMFLDMVSNPDDVLDIPTAPYRGAHYATFPPNLIAPLIRATCPRWCCPVCGQGWSPLLEQDGYIKAGHGGGSNKLAEHIGLSKTSSLRSEGLKRNFNVKEYRPTCEHPHTIDEAVPGIVFDPFVGSGTTVQVANELLRHGVGLDISMEYLDEQAKIRAGKGTPSKALDDLPMFKDLEGEH